MWVILWVFLDQSLWIIDILMPENALGVDYVGLKRCFTDVVFPIGYIYAVWIIGK
jgi:hypothetical protein